MPPIQTSEPSSKKTNKSVIAYLRAGGMVGTLLSVAIFLYTPEFFGWFCGLAYITITLLALDLFYEFRKPWLSGVFAIILYALTTKFILLPLPMNVIG
ncbi:MAG: hypothetical protein ABSH02_03160, partial [Candidatus Sulfotelmatobacter sp.]